MAKYKVGDKVKIRKDLLVDESYADGDHTVCYFTDSMKVIKEKYDYVTIESVNPWKDDRYHVREDHSGCWWSNEMFEESDRHKFERWMRELTQLDVSDDERWMRELTQLDVIDDTWNAFNNLTTLSINDDTYEKNLKLVADYLFGEEKKKMTKAEIEAELGYEIEIVEE